MLRIVQILLLATCAAVPLAGCGGGRPDAILDVRVGETCTVFFRHDALGMAADVPSGPTTNTQNGADLFTYGEVVDHNDEWLVIKREGRQFSIPVDVILMVEVSRKPPESTP